MERTKTSTNGEIRWKKEGGGSAYLKLNGKVKIIKPGQVFSARPEEIPEGFRDIIHPLHLEELQSVEDAELPKRETVEYLLKHKGGGKYVVEDAEGKQVNEGVLSKEEAQVLIDTLS